MDELSAVETALDKLRPGLAADGFDLRIGDRSDSETVDVVLEAKPDACLDCLVPDDLLVRMIEDAIRRENVAVHRVNLVKIGFHSVDAH